MNTNTRIAIIGAGAAGLSLAWRLRDQGFRTVVVFEKEAQAGGKCRTLLVDGLSYEMGAIFHLRGAQPVEQMVKRLGIRTMQGTVQPRERRGVPLFDTESPRLLPNPKIPGLLRSAFRYARLRKQYPGLFDPGHHNMAAHLAMPFDEWLAKHNVAELEPLFACWTSGFGYGPNSRIPAAYGLKFCHPAMLWRIFFLKGGRCFTEGYQNLWTRVAAELDVRLNHRVSSITRGDRVIIRTGAAEHEFDKVVMACDLRAIAPALDTDPEEAELISKIRSHRYHVMVAEVTGLPVRIAFVPGHFREHRKSGLLCWYHRWKEKNLHTL